MPLEPKTTLVSNRSELKVSSGPIPDPETLAAYEKVYPGLARTIVVAFEAEYQKRHRLETISMDGDIEAMRRDHADVARGQWLGFLICIIGLAGGVWLVSQGHDWAGALVATSGLASVVAAYFKNSEKQ